jgi:hypothetical protein
MTRRQLAKALSADIRKRGDHYQKGTSIFVNMKGEWSGFAGLHPPPPDTAYYELVGWDMVAARNTTERVDIELFRIERKRRGLSKHLGRKYAPEG